ncbi:MAG: PaaI family thioesterase [Christensenellales bacterium]|jgi:acyl-CoA thioesterase
MNLNELKSFFSNDVFARNMGIKIESAGEDGAVCTLLAAADHMNAGGMVQGGAIFTLADLAFAVAANAGGAQTVTLNCSISYLSGARAGLLTAKSTAVHKGRRTCVYSVDVTDESGRLVATANITGARVAEK